LLELLAAAPAASTRSSSGNSTLIAISKLPSMLTAKEQRCVKPSRTMFRGPSRASARSAA